MNEDDYQRGRTDERLDANDRRHLDNMQRFDNIEKKLNEIASTMTVAKSGLRLLLAVGTISATLGAFAHNVISWFSEHVK